MRFPWTLYPHITHQEETSALLPKASSSLQSPDYGRPLMSISGRPFRSLGLHLGRPSPCFRAHLGRPFRNLGGSISAVHPDLVATHLTSYWSQMLLHLLTTTHIWKSLCKLYVGPSGNPLGKPIFVLLCLRDREDHNGQDVPSIELFDPCSSFEFGIWIRVLVLPVLMSMM